MAFKPVQSDMDFVKMEQDLLDSWYKDGIVEKYLSKNNSSSEKFSFLDGPITANNPMGVHHGWGRTYKDLYQRYWNMRGKKQRFQNGFDEQGLWVEVEVEKELGLRSKKDIEELIVGDRYASLEKFINLCKERVKKYSDIQTDQSKRLGYFMDWDNSYHTSSDENNYSIWKYLKVVNDKGWLYKGHDSVPWCPRCGTAISQHEILTEEYKEVIHDSVYFELPIKGKEDEYLLVWTTTPWTIPANVSVAADPEKDYVVATGNIEGNRYYLLKNAAEKLDLNILETIKGSEMVGWEYEGPFDHLPRVQKAMEGSSHRIIATDPMILPISEEDGTGLVHIAPGAGSEDFKLGQKYELPVVEVIDEEANYLDGMEDFSAQNAKKHPELIIDFLKEEDSGKFLFQVAPFKHRYPTCWRCKTELVWRVVDEWYISMDIVDDSGKTYREQMIEVIKDINWMPKWGYERELDWLKNMHDWLISKKRYWGLSLPIWECKECGNFEVVGSKEELKEKAVEGWELFDGHTPHKPWVDKVLIKCSKCSAVLERIPDVGNPWLDAGIVPFSTMPEDWFPADFVTESFPGQFKNWFYSLIAMSTALSNKAPLNSLLGYGLLVDEKGNPMHKSSGNSIEFNEAADQMGADIMRWMYLLQNPEDNLRFGFQVASDIKRRFYLIFWNCYKYFVEYAVLSDWSPQEISKDNLTVLDKWVLSRLNEVVILVNEKLERYDAMSASRAIEDFVINDLSTWYIRRSRDRVGLNAREQDQAVFLSTTFEVLVTLVKLMAPFTPFITEEIFKNLSEKESVHLEDYPLGDKELVDEELSKSMKYLRDIVEKGHAKRKEAGVKLRQPLASITYGPYHKPFTYSDDLKQILLDELNVKEAIHDISLPIDNQEVILDISITPELQAEGDMRELIRQIQIQRKEQGLKVQDKVRVTSPNLPEDHDLLEQVKKNTNTLDLIKGEQFIVEQV